MVQVQKRKHTRFVSMGPRPIPVVPVGNFTKAGGKTHHEMLEELWEIIGPSVELNLRQLPLWKVITMAYFEGSVHAVQMIEDEKNGNVS
jgi:hypothetical protein